MAAFLMISLFLFKIAVGEKICNSTDDHVCSVEKHKAMTFRIGNPTITHNRNINLPKIKEGDPCTPGKSYKMDCNRCQCTSAKKLICTKMACVDWPNFVNLESSNLRRHGLHAAPNFNKKEHLNKKTKKDSKAHMSKLPTLPSGACVPGRIYRKGCRRCFCNHLLKAQCSNDEKGACTIEYGRPKPIRQPEDVRPPFKREELKKIKELESMSEKCEPGKIFKVSCNTCICTDKSNLICTRSLCLSFDYINQVEANERSGKKCTGTEETKADCIKCKCLKEKTACEAIRNCVKDTRQRLSKDGTDLKIKIDPIKDKCVPNGIYTDDCNHCYCQADGSLRCTLKQCLNYTQAKALDEQIKRIKKKSQQ